MATKTITVTENAYEALRVMKASRESFSETILRITRRKPLSAFFGVLSPETGAALERTITVMRRKRAGAHQRRLQHLREALRS